MSILITGDRLNPEQKRLVLQAYTFRWTFENQKQNYYGRCPGCVQHEQTGGDTEVSGVSWHDYHAPLVTDDEWLKQHAFYFQTGGRELARESHCEPAFMAGED